MVILTAPYRDVYNGEIKEHWLQVHRQNIDRKAIVECTKIRYREHDKTRLEILEALIILNEKPEINKQDTGKKRKQTLFQ